MLWMCLRMQRVIDRSPIWLSAQQKTLLQRSTDQFLKTYQWLAKEARNRGLRTWPVRPKLHYIWHMMDELDVIHLNPKVHSCWGSEKWLQTNQAVCEVNTWQQSCTFEGFAAVRGVLESSFHETNKDEA